MTRPPENDARPAPATAARGIGGARAIVVMGVSGCGKSSVGTRLAAALGWRFVEGDDLHPAANVRKMAAGQPLADADRWPWLDAVGHAMRNAINASGSRDAGVVAGCSALRQVYRERLDAAAEERIGYVLLEGSIELIGKRLATREQHFMPPSLLRSQFETLEPPAADERAIRVAIDAPLESVVASIVAAVGRDPPQCTCSRRSS